MELIKKIKKSSITLSIIMIILGICIMIWPKISVITLSYLIGAILVVAGIIKIIGYFSNDMYNLAFQFDFGLGIFAIILGTVIIFHPVGLISILPFIIGILILVDGIFKLQTSLESKRFGIKNWWSIMLLSIITSVFGLILILNPFSGAITLMFVIGIALTVCGIQNLTVTLNTIKYYKDDSTIDVTDDSSVR